VQASPLLLALLPSLPLGAAAGAPAQGGKVAPPPGLVLVEGGKTRIGTPESDIEKLFSEFPTTTANAAPFISETPESTLDVDGFFLMVTELTNEQFAAYVRATGARPPQGWAEAAIAKARDEYLAAQNATRKEAVARGERPPAQVPFAAADWWRENWRGSEWTAPDDKAGKPVVYVDYQDAVAYARWAGLRLPTEHEFTRAVRGNGDDPYAWGEGFEAGKQAATSEIKGKSDAFPVGSFPEGASKQGVFDLSGNVWEWTASPYMPLPKWKARKYTYGKGRSQKTIDVIPGWTPDYRVVKSGSIQNPRFMARCTTRRGADRYEQASLLGFRCAASVAPGADLAGTLLDDIPTELRPRDVNGALEYMPKLTLALDRWQTAPASKVAVEGYSIITGYDYIAFVPIAGMHAVNESDVRKASLEQGLVHVGLFATNQPLRDPQLPAGSYLVTIRGKGETPKKKEEKKPEKPGDGPAAGAPAPAGQDPAPAPVVEQKPIEERIALDITKDNFVLFDMTGEPVAAIPIQRFNWGDPSVSDSKMRNEDITVMVPGLDAKGKEIEIPEEQRWLLVDFFVKGRTAKGLKTTLPLRFPDGVLENEWRQ